MNDAYAKQIVQHLVQQGVRRVCISPGSRSTPLAYAFSKEERLEKLVHFDERGTGFYAYGYAKASKTPVALLVTSGTSVVNLFPAIMEAFQDEVPLIVITADRPHELRECGANQTCDQVKIFGDHVRWYFEIPCPDQDIPPGFIGSTIAQAVYRATQSPKGPVHLNCLFREPFLSEYESEIFPSTHYEPTHHTLSTASIEQWAKRLNMCERGVIIAGSMATSRSLKSIFTLAEVLDWPILPDVISGLRSEGLHHNVIPYYDMVLKLVPHFRPDCILHFGDRLVSKPLFQWMKQAAPPLYAMVADHPERHDPAHQLSHRIQSDPTVFCEQLLPWIPRRVSWLNNWKALSQVIEGHVDEFVPPASEPGLVRFLQHHLPPHYSLFFANSMPIRDGDQFFFPRFHRAPIYGKRGTSGIDGNIATIVGLAEGSQRPILAVIGDLTALHDLNSLALLQKCKVPIILLVVNNQGGGIFSFLPISQKKEIFEEYVAGVHPWHFEEAAKMFHLPFFSMTDPAQLTRILREEKSVVIEFKTNRIENHALHLKIEDQIKEKIQALAYAVT
ncbi:MAG TPA: 2-succinyl-5-enolpyruvyl-6-hydroxy-3-cyclohexene-1-carboxylic-acid synthase [Rhabdochlamydiaceae bacterium]|nr:2-succinyl-5-enolpyruvyl-6-hydroxy-3-cyclohexene-1-carboxylic-acid synthase [Rhabdochlamydiaceae bacterium]